MIDWLVTNSWALWLIVFLILAVIEMVTLDLFFIMMSVGALAAVAASLLGSPFWLQTVIFCLVALLMIVFVRPIAMRHLHKGPHAQRTNIGRLIGAEALALEPVTGTSGLVKIAGDTWSARSDSGEAYPAGTQVQVLQIKGATAVVGPGSTGRSGKGPDGSGTTAGGPYPEH